MTVKRRRGGCDSRLSIPQVQATCEEFVNLLHGEQSSSVDFTHGQAVRKVHAAQSKSIKLQLLVNARRAPGICIFFFSSIHCRGKFLNNLFSVLKLPNK